MDKSTRNTILNSVPYGLFIVGADGASGPVLIIANWITQVSFSPPLLAFALENPSEMRSAVLKSGQFSVNMLPSGGKEIARSFLKRGEQDLEPLIHRSASGLPLLKQAVAHLECKITQNIETGDHTLVIAEVIDGAMQSTQDRVRILTLEETGWKYSR